MKKQTLYTDLNYAKIYAIEMHGDQMYGENVPYVKHLDDVVAVLKEYRIKDENILIAGMLHDIIEDTKVTFEDLVSNFGERIADIVERVSNKPGNNRAEKHAATYPAIRRSQNAVLVKLADRIANMRSGAKNRMYQNEYEDFKKYLYVPSMSISVQQMWEELDQLNTLDIESDSK